MAVRPDRLRYCFTDDFADWIANYPGATLWYMVSDHTAGVEIRGLSTDEEALWVLRWGPPMDITPNGEVFEIKQSTLTC